MGYRNTWFWHILTIQLQTILLAIIFCCEPFSHWWLLRFSSLLALLAGTWSHGPLYQSTSLYIRYPSFPERNDGTVLQDPFPFCFGCEAVGNFRDAWLQEWSTDGKQCETTSGKACFWTSLGVLSVDHSWSQIYLETTCFRNGCKQLRKVYRWNLLGVSKSAAPGVQWRLANSCWTTLRRIPRTHPVD